MRRSNAIRLSIMGTTCVLFGGLLEAATIQTIGVGSAVSVVDRSATFDTLTSSNPVDLGNYSEGGLFITTGMTSWADDVNLAARLDPFHGANAPDRAFFCVSWENREWTSIRTTNQAVIHGVEFMYGNGWTTGDPYGPYPWGNPDAVLEWQTWRDNTNVFSGSVGGTPLLQMGTIVGFYDPAGFDELLMKATIASSGDPTLNALALDNLNVMLTNVPPAPVIYGSDFGVDPTSHVPTLTVDGTITGCEYRMVFTESLSTPVWVPVTPPSPDGWKPGGGTLTLSDPGAVGRSQRFYRVEVR
jgi:hypothetical protein